MTTWDDLPLYSVLLMGVVAVSFGAILVRFAEAPSLVIATYRLVLASLIVAPVGLLRRWGELRALSRGDLAWAGLSGALLTLHFAFWISSLEYTTVASSVVFVSTSPIFVGVASHFLTRDKLSLAMSAGIAVALLGGMVIGWNDLELGGQALRGDLLAIVGAVMVGGYFMAGRKLRPTTSLLAYVTVVYSVAALGALVLCVLTEQRLAGYSVQTYVMLLLLAVGPQIIGHSSLNWALRHLPAAAVGVVTLGEPVGSTVLACLLLSEVPSPLKVAGGGLILAGIYLSLQQRKLHRTAELNG
ncbi:MAG TPA: DMT family transporter [Anaerolineae bacterium]|nr:DMT family transporter [Anaerolineae bacterium]